MDRISCRALIIHENKLLTVKIEDHKHFSLPGGTLDPFEELNHCLSREMVEELGIAPQIGNIAFIHELILGEETHVLEFFYIITNPQDFLSIDMSKASHAFEIEEIHWLDLAHPEDTFFLPKGLIPLLQSSTPEDLQKTRIITSK